MATASGSRRWEALRFRQLTCGSGWREPSFSDIGDADDQSMLVFQAGPRFAPSRPQAHRWTCRRPTGCFRSPRISLTAAQGRSRHVQRDRLDVS